MFTNLEYLATVMTCFVQMRRASKEEDEGARGSRRLYASPVRPSRRSARFDSSPARESRSRTYEPSPSRGRSNVQDERAERTFRRYDVSPLRISFESSRSSRRKKSPVRESRRSGRYHSLPDPEAVKSSLQFRKMEEAPVVESVGFERSRWRDPERSPVRSSMRFRIQDTSPGRETSRSDSVRFRKASPSPARVKNRQFNFTTNPYLDDDYETERNVDFVPPSPRLSVRGPAYRRQPFRELPNTGRASKSYRISSTSRDDDSDLDYLTKVREILLGDPIKGKTETPAQILPHMYIGNQSNAESLRLLRKLGITHVLNCAGFKGPRKNPDANPYEGLDIEYLEFKADDRDAYDISQHFDAAFSYLDRVKRSGGACLVHCALGINRSGATVIAYLMIHSKYPLLKAIKVVKDKRGVVLSNHGFQRQLIRFARQQGLLDDLPQRARREIPEVEHKFAKSMLQAKYGHWTEALEELKRKPVEYRERVRAEPQLGSGPQSAIMYRYARFMNRDKV